VCIPRFTFIYDVFLCFLSVFLELFGQYGSIRQIRLFVPLLLLCFICSWSSFFSRGNTPETKGTAFVIYDDIYDAKNACEHLSGYSFCQRFAYASMSRSVSYLSVVCRYLVVLYYSQLKQTKKLDQKKQQAELDRLRATYMKKPADKDVAT
jgi:pre-mRNA branch site protein p14